jgi:exopolysaccharide production protein ExoZ
LAAAFFRVRHEAGDAGVIYNLQYLRALAALLVVFYHGEAIWNQFAAHKMALFDAGAGGVDVFFVISGLIMWVTTCDGRHSAGAFIRNRLIRIVPLYWLMTALKLALALALPFLTDLQLDPVHITASFAFVAWPEPGTGIYAPLLQPGWTLNLEMFFYAAFAAALLLPVRLRPLAICGFLALCTVAGLNAIENSSGAFYGSPIVLEFAAGIVLAAYIAPWAQRLTVPRTAYALIALLGLVLLVVLPWQQGRGLWSTVGVGPACAAAGRRRLSARASRQAGNHHSVGDPWQCILCLVSGPSLRRHFC